MSEKGLTPRREKFAQSIARGMSQTDAYRAAYSCGNSKSKSIHEHASRLAANAKILARVAQLRAPVVAKIRYEVEQAMAECDEAIALAKKNDSASAMVAAVQLKSKLNGLLVEDRRNQRKPLEELTDDQLDGLIKQKATDAGINLR